MRYVTSYSFVNELIKKKINVTSNLLCVLFLFFIGYWTKYFPDVGDLDSESSSFLPNVWSSSRTPGQSFRLTFGVRPDFVPGVRYTYAYLRTLRDGILV